METPLTSKQYRIWFGWMAVIFIWSAYTTNNLYQQAYSEEKSRIINDYGDSFKSGLHSESITNWLSLKTALSNPEWCKKTSEALVAEEDQLRQKKEPEVTPPSSIHTMDDTWIPKGYNGHEEAAKIRDPEWRIERINEADKNLAIIESALHEASLSSFSNLYFYWLIVPLLFGVGPGLLVMMIKSRFVHSCIMQYGSLRVAGCFGVVLFILIFLLATPKVYRVFPEGIGTITTVAPLLYERPSEAGVALRFDGLNTSVIIGELLVSMAIGVAVWFFASGVCRRKDEPIQATPTIIHRPPPVAPPPSNKATSSPEATSKDIPNPRLNTNDLPREVFVEIYKSIPELPIRGGWGYSMEDAVIIDKNDPIVFKVLPFNGITIEHIFVEKRIYCELIVYQPKDDRYSGINWKPILQELREINDKHYDVLTFDVTALHDKDFAMMKAVWEGPNGYGSQGFDQKEHFKKHAALEIHYVAEYWFDITSFYGSCRKEENEDCPVETL
jgi:hypothetical protein